LTEGEEAWAALVAPGSTPPPTNFMVVVGEEGFGAGVRGTP